MKILYCILFCMVIGLSGCRTVSKEASHGNNHTKSVSQADVDQNEILAKAVAILF